MSMPQKTCSMRWHQEYTSKHTHSQKKEERKKKTIFWYGSQFIWCCVEDMSMVFRAFITAGLELLSFKKKGRLFQSFGAVFATAQTPTYCLLLAFWWTLGILQLVKQVIFKYNKIKTFLFIQNDPFMLVASVLNCCFRWYRLYDRSGTPQVTTSSGTGSWPSVPPSVLCEYRHTRLPVICS